MLTQLGAAKQKQGTDRQKNYLTTRNMKWHEKAWMPAAVCIKGF